MVTTRSMDEQQNTRDLIRQMQEQIQAQARTIQAQAQAHQEMQQKHAKEIAALRAEQVHTERSASNRENENDGSRNRQQSHHINPNDGRRGPSTVRPTSLHPFTTTIMQAPMPEKSPSVLEKYDGSTDPDNHLRIFTSAMVFYTDSDPVICRAFSLSLKDDALEWYNTLPPNTVDCFATVETLFRRQYASNRKQETTAAELVNTRQEKGETLKAFMKRYNETARRVKEARPPKTMEELQERVAEFIRMEDMRISQRRQQHEFEAGGKRKDNKQTFNNHDKSKDFSHSDFVRTPRFNHYTTFNAPRAKVLEEALNDELLTIQEKCSPKNADEQKSCRFHLNHGHTIEECGALKDEIERLIRAGHLQKFVKGERAQRRSPPRGRSLRRSPGRSYQGEEHGRKYNRSRSQDRERERSVRGRID
ncbi:uncharacterized protein LOC106763706 [Vigna radiata var. radiata]|uniref:Uncharacterized protein LOC106763706 n=1 Tax=Vigna radiata var. radiata TaxID=3916 RepID=A0A1S3UBF1_VIGRR|nr:uncharacterized protein LOC106763706 [Vigna radiata var. radiata]